MGGDQEEREARRESAAVMDGITILDLREVKGDENWWYTFTWRGPRWQEAFFELKNAIPNDDRRYDEETHVWSVRVTAETALELAIIFPNFWSSIAARRSQMSLFEVSND